MSVENSKITIELNNVFKSGLSIEQYFVLYCVFNKHKSLLEQYIEKCGKMDKLRFKELADLGYIEPFNENNIVFEVLFITSKTLSMFGWSKSPKDYFNELKAVYPSKVKIYKGYRRLHQDLPRCERLYKEIVENNEEIHNLVIKCVKLYVRELENTGKLEFIQMLSTFLHQRSYDMYMEEAKSSTELEDTTYNNVEEI